MKFSFSFTIEIFFCQTYIILHFSLQISTLLPAKIFDPFKTFFCRYRTRHPIFHRRKKSKITFAPQSESNRILLFFLATNLNVHSVLSHVVSTLYTSRWSIFARNRHRSLSIRRMSPSGGRLPRAFRARIDKSRKS